MKLITIVWVFGIITLFIAAGCDFNPFEGEKGDSESQEAAKAISVEDLSQSVVSAIKTAFPDCVIEEVYLEDENGKEVFEAEIKVDGNTLEVMVTPDGKIIETEQEIELSDLPDTVIKAINDTYPDESIEEAVIITRGQTILYEIDIVSEGKEIEVELDADGNVVEEELEYEDQNDSDENHRDDLYTDDVDSEREFEGEREED